MGTRGGKPSNRLEKWFFAIFGESMEYRIFGM
jgi:hypothetical protein